jgi:hypothetical protein
MALLRALERRPFRDGRVTEGTMAAAIPTARAAFSMVVLGEDHTAVVEIKVVLFEHALLWVSHGRSATNRVYPAHARP